MIRKMRDFPRCLQIRDNLWEVRFVRRCPNEPEDTLGLCDPGEQVLYIRLRQTPMERMKTFIHELAHALAYEWGIKENHDIIHKLEEPLLRLFLDNGVTL